MIKILSWNLAGRVRMLSAQIDQILDENPDVVCLQEIIDRTHKPLRTALERAKYHVSTSADYRPTHFEPGEKKKARQYLLLTATRTPLERLEPPHEIGWQEKYLACSAVFGERQLEVTQMHIPPGSSNGFRKITTIREAYENFRRSSAEYRILAGDWNTPKEELETGEIITWGRPAGRGMRGEEWDRGERLLLEGTKKLGYRDVFRTLHGYQKPAFSWQLKRGQKNVNRRFDHIYATANFSPISCDYRHSWRLAGLSDHAAIVAELGWEEKAKPFP